LLVSYRPESDGAVTCLVLLLFYMCGTHVRKESSPKGSTLLADSSKSSELSLEVCREACCATEIGVGTLPTRSLEGTADNLNDRCLPRGTSADGGKRDGLTQGGDNLREL